MFWFCLKGLCDWVSQAEEEEEEGGTEATRGGTEAETQRGAQKGHTYNHPYLSGFSFLFIQFILYFTFPCNFIDFVVNCLHVLLVYDDDTYVQILKHGLVFPTFNFVSYVGPGSSFLGTAWCNLWNFVEFVLMWGST